MDIFSYHGELFLKELLKTWTNTNVWGPYARSKRLMSQIPQSFFNIYNIQLFEFSKSPIRNFDYQKISTRFRSGGVRSRKNDDEMALVRFFFMDSGCYRSRVTECPRSLIFVRGNFLWKMNCVRVISGIKLLGRTAPDIVRVSSGIFHPPETGGFWSWKWSWVSI